ncbi:MAG: hypothetical protein AB7N80_12010 [Bdellovibrionales bacterium]
MKKIAKMMLGSIATFLALGTSTASAGYYSMMDTGRLLTDGHYKLGAETQFITEGDDGINLSATIDGPWNEELNWRGLVGFGTTDIFLGGFVKWVPFPDADKQPAVGVLFGVLYANYEDISELNLRAHPFVSKNFSLEIGDLTPYAALPLGLRTADGDTDLTSQIAIGAEYRPDAFEKIRFLAEMGFELNDSFPYFSVGASIDFDEENGLEFK